MAKRVDIIIGPEKDYDDVNHKDILYICNDTSKAYIPDNEEEKDTGWMPCYNVSNFDGTLNLKARQVGKVVTISGFINYNKIEEGDILANIPFSIGRPEKNIDLDFHQKRSAEKNRGLRLRVTTNGTLEVSKQYSFNDEDIYFTFTYIVR